MNEGRNYSNTKSKGSKFERKHDFGKCTSQISLVVFYIYMNIITNPAKISMVNGGS
jgi:hypothetical protein